MKMTGPKYMRDFFPEEMARREWIESAWAEASRRAGFQAWDGPILETLDLYKRKSGDEIVEQLFNVTSKGGQELAVRPEMTPSLARMVASRQASLPRPIKWYTIGRMCRYERGQRGRLREFWQWNVDLLGIEGPAADAEVMSVALDGLLALGLTAEDVACHINSRTLLASILTALGVPADLHAGVYALLDKRGKIPAEELDKKYRALGLSEAVVRKLLDLMAGETLDDVVQFARTNNAGPTVDAELERVAELFEAMDALGKREFCRFDIGIVRGLAYYTGPVFEIFDRQGELRAVCGGGRYDQLMEVMGGQSMPACGFGMGDVVLGELLQERKINTPALSPIEWLLVPLEADRLPDVLRLAARLRNAGDPTDFLFKPTNLSKVFKRADELGARRVVLVGGQEWATGQVRIRDMQSREETLADHQDFQ